MMTRGKVPHGKLLSAKTLAISAYVAADETAKHKIAYSVRFSVYADGFMHV